MKSILPFALAGFFAAVVHAQTDTPVITRAPVSADEKPSAAPAPSPDAAALTDLRDQNKELSQELASAWKENDKLKTSALAQVAAANQKTAAVQADLDAKTRENDTLKAQLADAQKSLDDLHKTAAASTADSAALESAKADRDKLAADLLKANDEKNSLSAQLEAAQNDLTAQKQKTTDAETERDDLKQKLAAQAGTGALPAAAVDTSALDDLKKQEAETEDKLNTSLHSYTILQGENDQIKDELAKATDDKNSLATQLDDAKRQIADLAPKAAAATAAAAAAANELAGVRDQLRQTQNLVAQLATENSDLKTRLAFASQNGAALPPPARPAPAIAPMPVPAAAATPPPPPAATGPHTYKVVAGDTLGKISKQFYGTANRWPEILAANHDKLHDDKSLRVGMELKIP